MGEQGNQGRLPHVGRFAAHVRAGDQQQPALVAENGVVGDEGFAVLGDLAFHHRVAAAFDAQPRLGRKLRAAVVAVHRHLGKSGQHVEQGHGAGDFEQARDLWLQCFKHRFVEHFFAGQRAVLRGQRLVLEGFQLGGDIALGVLQRLPAAVVFRNALDVSVGDFDIEAMHAVVFHLQAADASALAFARFQRDEEIAAVVLDAAQLVEIGVVAVGDDTAVAQVG